MTIPHDYFSDLTEYELEYKAVLENLVDRFDRDKERDKYILNGDLTALEYHALKAIIELYFERVTNDKGNDKN